MKALNTIPLILLSIVLSSCEEVFLKEIDYEIPRDDDKVTISAKLNAGEPALALVGLSAYSMGNYDPILDRDSEVKLYEDGKFIEKLYPDSSTLHYNPGNYVGNYILKAGHNYRIEGARSGYETAFGESFIKAPVHFTEPTSAIKEKNEIRVQFTFTDPAEKGDYYLFYGSIRNPNQETYPARFNTYNTAVEVFDSQNDPFETQNGIEGVYGYISDQTFNGQSKTINLRFSNFYDPQGEDSLKIEMHLLRISEDYYKFDKSVAGYGQAPPIFAEPVQIYSNVVNGYGIVAGATLTRIVLTP